MGPSGRAADDPTRERREICSRLALAGSEALALVVPAVQRTRERMLRHARDNRTREVENRPGLRTRRSTLLYTRLRGSPRRFRPFPPRTHSQSRQAQTCKAQPQSVSYPCVFPPLIERLKASAAGARRYQTGDDAVRPTTTRAIRRWRRTSALAARGGRFGRNELVLDVAGRDHEKASYGVNA